MRSHNGKSLFADLIVTDPWRAVAERLRKAWGKSALRTLASWRYRFKRYERPWELNVSKRVIRLWDPRVSGL